MLPPFFPQKLTTYITTLLYQAKSEACPQFYNLRAARCIRYEMRGRSVSKLDDEFQTTCIHFRRSDKYTRRMRCVDSLQTLLRLPKHKNHKSINKRSNIFLGPGPSGVLKVHSMKVYII
ncbi:predicted protein [Sclerotinia sclerotiorum 1980 UF-70]|uniref:Uncharacterized protein n=1 Tax=Sclerotinia sclerotiorum (strain ATCC 18683 / 1980 / Ss-1) TaxID=665079 RepID=A7EYW4_SCLS1|nr:predicted protein [Sclerotinia sclerotiorum 1980 UF-70]EDN94656.1 predicted protein [Sclerotinia sclerotiorum 1980 UF-70]